MELSFLARGEQALRQAWPPDAGCRWEFHILKWREQQQERLVADCALRHPQAQRSRQRVIAKWYADGTGDATFALMQTLAGKMDGGLLATPRALFYDPTAHLLVQQVAPGVAYKDLMERRSYSHYLRQAGRALARLHRLPGLPGLPGRGKRLEEQMADLMRPHPRQLAQRVPELSQRVDALAAAMLQAEAAWPADTTVAWLHRDFHLGQLFYGRGQVWVIDWDLAAHGDPALDVGNFLRYLDQFLAARGPAGRAAFLEGYQDEGEKAVLARAAIYESFSWLRMACKNFRLQARGWRAEVARLVASGERCLEKDGLARL
jgi:aminoglycoside phosphotransferase (APT) family kinase protein